MTLHGFGETNPMYLPRWQWAFLDTGSNIVVAWAIARAAVGDHYSENVRRRAMPALTALMIAGVALHFVVLAGKSGAGLVVSLNGWGGFNAGETWLIGFSLLTTGLFLAKWRALPAKARPLLASIVFLSLCGGVLAGASNETIVWPFIPLHALWHIVSAVYLTLFWAFNHVRLEALRPAGPLS